MRILSFQKEFKDKLLDGTKISTIRRHKLPHKAGDFVQIWCPSPRSGHGEKLFEAKIVQSDKIILGNVTMLLNGMPCDAETVNIIAKKDGFEDGASLFCWFHRRYGKDVFYGTRYVFGKGKEGGK